MRPCLATGCQCEQPRLDSPLSEYHVFKAEAGALFQSHLGWSVSGVLARKVSGHNNGQNGRFAENVFLLGTSRDGKIPKVSKSSGTYPLKQSLKTS